MNVTTADFETEVIAASRRLPVVADFWAPWCGPCRTLSPIIEKVAGEFAGRVKLVKVDSDQNPELSQALGIRSIPTVVAFRDGRTVSHFLGAVPESQVRAFFEKLLPSPSEEALRRAEALYQEGRYDDAEQALSEVKSGDPALDARAEALRHGIAFARAGADGPGEDALRAKLETHPDDHDARLALAGVYASQRRYAQAMEELLEIVQRAKNWRDGEARRQMLAVFDLAGSDSALVAEYRR
ncbi:MAG: thioredoxin, partial [Gammaproteobacteria bacterium]|nr:thioredoxin [Gammaproteobacteria bacterium]